MFGYAGDETEDRRPLTHSMPTRSGKTLTDVRKSGVLWWLRPDARLRSPPYNYVRKADVSVEPQKTHTAVISTRRAKPPKTISMERG